MRFNVCLDTQKFKSKPSTPTAISKRIASKVVQVDINELAQAVSQGQTWCSVTFNGGRKNENFVQAQVIGLDFDKNTDPQQVITKAFDLGLKVNLIYSTFSDTPKFRKFRAVFVLDTPITDHKVYSRMVKGFQAMFPDCDRACKDLARLWYGSKSEPIWVDLTVNPLDKVEFALNAIDIAGATEPNKNRTAKTINKSFLETSDDVEVPEVLEKIDIEADLLPKLKILQCAKAGHFIEAAPGYEVGERLHYEELKGLTWNLQYIKGGLQWLRTCLDEAGVYEDYHYALLHQVRAYTYLPMNLCNFSPYKEDHRFVNILAATGKGNYTITEDPNFRKGLQVYTLEGAEQMFSDKWNEFLAADDNKVYVFRVPTGMGKTEYHVNLLRNLNKKCEGGYTFAYATHDLKDEACVRAGVKTAEELFGGILESKNKGVTTKAYANTFVTPRMPSNLPTFLRAKLEYFQTVGLHSAYKNNLAEYKKSLKALSGAMTDIEKSVLDELEIYSMANHAAYGCTRENIITTHAKALITDSKGNFPFSHNNTLIFDEDPLQSICNLDSVTLEDFQNLREATTDDTIQKVCKKYIDFINDEPPEFREKEQYYFTPEQVKHLGDLIVEGQQTKRYSSALLKFLSSAKVYGKTPEQKGEIIFSTRNSLPSDRKIGIFSATANEEIYRLLLGDRLVFIDLTKTLCKGQLEQDTTYSCSRSSLKKDTNAAKYVVEKVGKLPVITHTTTKALFDNPVEELHFGNCSGSDKYKGQDLAVVGTPHIPTCHYLLMAKTLGIELEFRDFDISRRVITRNGFTFPLMTFERDILTSIQCYFIEKELYQAIGRSRTLREDAKVLLMSNYPIRYYWEGDDSLKGCIIEYSSPGFDYFAQNVIEDEEDLILAF